jgi:hypothetical protein
MKQNKFMDGAKKWENKKCLDIEKEPDADGRVSDGGWRGEAKQGERAKECNQVCVILVELSNVS